MAKPMTLDDVMQKVTDYADARLDYSETGTDKIYETSFNIARFAIHRYAAEQVAQYKQDAERYRYIRQHPAMLLHLSHRDFDVAVDNAIRARAQEE